MKKKTLAQKIREEFILKLSSANLSFDDFIEVYQSQIYQTIDQLFDVRKLSVFDLSIYAELLVAYTDMQMILSYQNRENQLTEEEYVLLDLQQQILDMDDFLAEISANPFLLPKMYQAMVKFYHLSFFGKYNILLSVDTKTDDYLSSFTPTHQEELEEYVKEIELEDYISYFDGEVARAADGVDLEQIMKGMVGFLRNLAKYNYENYVENVRDLAIFSYEWMKFFIDHDPSFLPDKEDAESFIDFFEKNGFSTLEEEVLVNDALAELLLDYYIDMSALKEVQYGEITIDFEVAKQYTYEAAPQQIKENLEYRKGLE